MIGPGAMVGLALARAALAHPRVEEALEAAPPDCEDRGTRWLSVAQSYAEEGRPEAAKEAVERAAACGMDPGVLAPWRALLQASGHDPAAALPLLDEAVRTHESHLGLRLARARVLAELGLYEPASEDWRYAFERMDKPSPDEVLRWSRALMAAGQPRQALNVIDRGIERLGPAPALVCAALEAESALGWTVALQGRLDGLPDTPFWRAKRQALQPLAWWNGGGTP